MGLNPVVQGRSHSKSLAIEATGGKDVGGSAGTVASSSRPGFR